MERKKIILLLALCSVVLGEDCVTYTFGDDFEDLFSNEIGVCSAMRMWIRGEYSDIPVESPDELSTSFIAPDALLSCVSSFTFPMTAGGIVEVNLFMAPMSPADQVSIVVNEVVPGGTDAAVGNTGLSAMNPSFVSGWHSLNVSLTGSGTFDGYISLMGMASMDSIVLIDSFRYIPPWLDESLCQIYVEMDVTTAIPSATTSPPTMISTTTTFSPTTTPVTTPISTTPSSFTTPLPSTPYSPTAAETASPTATSTTTPEETEITGDDQIDTDSTTASTVLDPTTLSTISSTQENESETTSSSYETSSDSINITSTFPTEEYPTASSHMSTNIESTTDENISSQSDQTGTTESITQITSTNQQSTTLKDFEPTGSSSPSITETIDDYSTYTPSTVTTTEYDNFTTNTTESTITNFPTTDREVTSSNLISTFTTEQINSSETSTSRWVSTTNSVPDSTSEVMSTTTDSITTIYTTLSTVFNETEPTEVSSTTKIEITDPTKTTELFETTTIIGSTIIPTDYPIIDDMNDTGFWTPLTITMVVLLSLLLLILIALMFYFLGKWKARKAAPTIIFDDYGNLPKTITVPRVTKILPEPYNFNKMLPV